MKDVKGCIEKLDKSMTKKEKLFFLNKVKLRSYDYIVDLGCANGRLLYEIDKRLKGKAKSLQLFGVEENEQMSDDYKFTHQFTRVEKLDDLPLQNMQNKKVLLLLSSVLHELDIGYIRDVLIGFINKYSTTVVIRDMCFKIPPKICLKELRKGIVFAEQTNYILDKYQKNMFNYIYQFWNIKSLYEFFLKYTYKENWESEKQEEYFCNTKLSFVRALTNFTCKYVKHYTLPYKKRQVKKDFGYKMRAYTHVKMILERK